MQVGTICFVLHYTGNQDIFPVMKPVDRIRHAIETKNGMIAYEVFSEEIMNLSQRVAPVLKISIENARDWVQDQLLDLACNHLLTIHTPEAWRSYIDTAVLNRARSRSRSLPLSILSFDALQELDRMELETQDEKDSGVFLEDESLNIYYTLPLRDRAVLKLAYCISPTDVEWKGLAIATQKDAVKLEQHFCEWFLESNMNDTNRESKIAAAYWKTIRLRNRQRRLNRQLDEAALQNPWETDAEDTILKHLETCTVALNRQYRRYHKLQQAFRQRIPVAEISQATGLSESDIYQVISRARKKIRNVLS
jgi:hypothetical protein